MSSVIKKRRKCMVKKKHRRLLRKMRHQRRDKKWASGLDPMRSGPAFIRFHPRARR